jgi:hypothetical protein
MKKGILLAGLVTGLLALAFSCGGGNGNGEKGDGGGNESCQAALPECETSVCVGNYSRKCSDDQKHYRYELCSEQWTCKDGECVTAACSVPGERECSGNTEYTLCLEDLSLLTPKSCEDGTVCKAGACVPQQCEDGKKACGFKAVLTCSGGTAWTAAKCEDNQYCDDKTAACADMESFCVENPLGARCASLHAALQCTAQGTFKETACKGDDVCVEGFCQPRACDVTYTEPAGPDGSQPLPDAGGPDLFLPEVVETTTIDLPQKKDAPLEKPAKAWVTITGGDFPGEQIKFKSAKQAKYVFKDKDLQVSMALGAYMMEVHFVGIEEGMVGHWSSEEPGAVQLMILFNDGTHDQAVVQWKYSSISYDATLDQFDAPGGRAIGSFSGVLEVAPEVGGGEPLTLTEGYFDVPRDE